MAILSSNIVITGDDTSESNQFGGRILVSTTTIGDTLVLGQMKLAGEFVIMFAVEKCPMLCCIHPPYWDVVCVPVR